MLVEVRIVLNLVHHKIQEAVLLGWIQLQTDV